MNNNRFNSLIIGTDGFLGHSIAEKLGRHVIRTSHKHRNGYTYLNLNNDVKGWEVPSNINTVYFCAACTSIDYCRKNSQESYLVNVTNTIALMKKFVEQGLTIIYPSTTSVFDGKKSFRKIEESVCPFNEYGRQKAEVENKLMRLKAKISIIRFSKILGPNIPLISNWIKQLKNNLIIQPFSDMVLSPISLDFAVQVMIGVAQSQKYGIWQVSGKEDINYSSLAKLIVKKMGFDQKLIQPHKVGDSELNLETIPQYTTLDTSRIENELNLTVPDLDRTIESCLIEN